MNRARPLPAAKPPQKSRSSVFRPPSPERGFSLLELSVSLLILGLLGLGLWKFLPAFNAVS
ncbi:MAG: prepilin-type N-terminal cleavage/methylation domain-containing protein, partial [Candidatus Accumulibacter sp.]|nr:prepilin-type N-terminal cleavage/methylation domain-containing protein [Accumulibacter sp.]